MWYLASNAQCVSFVPLVVFASRLGRHALGDPHPLNPLLSYSLEPSAWPAGD
jgi:hypothetical protein